MEHLTELLKGILEGCVLELISRGETYGYEITRRLKTMGFSDVVEGTVYAILLRLEKNGLVSTQKRLPKSARRANFTHSPLREKKSCAVFGNDGILLPAELIS